MGSATTRWDFEEYWQWPNDLRKMDLDAKRAVGVVIVEILDEMRRRSLEKYRNYTFGSRHEPTYYRGRWGSSLRVVTRGTGLTSGQAYGILQNVAPYAQDLAVGRRTGDLFSLEVWAEDKLGKDEIAARGFARRLWGSTGIQRPVIDIFTVALGPGTGFQEWADRVFARELDRVVLVGGRAR